MRAIAFAAALLISAPAAAETVSGLLAGVVDGDTLIIKTNVDPQKFNTKPPKMGGSTCSPSGPRRWTAGLGDRSPVAH